MSDQGELLFPMVAGRDELAGQGVIPVPGVDDSHNDYDPSPFSVAGAELDDTIERDTIDYWRDKGHRWNGHSPGNGVWAARCLCGWQHESRQTHPIRARLVWTVSHMVGELSDGWPFIEAVEG